MYHIKMVTRLRRNIELSGDILRTGQNMKQAETRMKALEAFLQGFTGASALYFKQIGGGA